jgi:hypothetical protein
VDLELALELDPSYWEEADDAEDAYLERHAA